MASGRVPRDLGRTLIDAFRIRQRADYDVFAVNDVQAAADLVSDVERLVTVLRDLPDTVD